MEKINSEQKNKKNLHKIFKKVFHGQFRDSTIHGLGHIINATHWITRILWLLLFSLSVAYCILTVVQAIIAYKNYTTKISSNTNFNIFSKIYNITYWATIQDPDQNSMYLDPPQHSTFFK